MRCAILVAPLLLTLLPLPTQATTYRVPGDTPSIQAAIDLCQFGDSVLVAPGTYPENLIMRSGIVVRGEGTADAVVVDGRFLGPVVLCDRVHEFTLETLTLTRGYYAAYPGGGGVSMDRSQGALTDCILADNQAGRDGGGISVVDSWATLTGCTFRDNTAGPFDGGGIFIYRSVVTVEACTLFRNLAQEGGGIAVTNASAATIRHCVMAQNRALGPGPSGGAIMVAASSAQIENNTIAGNQVAPGGASVALYSGSSVFARNIITASSWDGLSCGTDPVHCNDVWGSGHADYVGCAPDPSNFSADPLFCAAGALDFRLDQLSPCAPAQSPAGCGLIGALDVGCGPVAVAPATWGEIKSRFR